jgi:hypothetical protein
MRRKTWIIIIGTVIAGCASSPSTPAPPAPWPEDAGASPSAVLNTCVSDGLVKCSQGAHGFTCATLMSTPPEGDGPCSALRNEGYLPDPALGTGAEIDVVAYCCDR